MYFDHKSSRVVGQHECERGYEQSGTDCAQGIRPSCLFDNRSDLELKNRIGQKSSANSARHRALRGKMCKGLRWKNHALYCFNQCFIH